ncbi:MAG: tRNA (N6-threonylcarbamoyladenosine(37)-N6)-methyltransferase TrmO [Terracidiphilus sp.]
MQMQPIGVIHTPFCEARGTPIQSGAAEGVKGWVEVFDEFLPGLKDLGGFERIWLIYWFHQAASETVSLHVTPYLDTKPRGVFATRAPIRPNCIGLSPVRLLAIRQNRLETEGMDILDGTPLLDIKPYIPQFDCFENARSGWAGGANPRGILADGRFERKMCGRGVDAGKRKRDRNAQSRST